MTEVTTAVTALAADLTDALSALIVVALGVAVIPYGAKYAWRFFKGIAK